MIVIELDLRLNFESRGRCTSPRNAVEVRRETFLTRRDFALLRLRETSHAERVGNGIAVLSLPEGGAATAGIEVLGVNALNLLGSSNRARSEVGRTGRLGVVLITLGLPHALAGCRRRNFAALVIVVPVLERALAVAAGGSGIRSRRYAAAERVVPVPVAWASPVVRALTRGLAAVRKTASLSCPEEVRRGASGRRVGRGRRRGGLAALVVVVPAAEPAAAAIGCRIGGPRVVLGDTDIVTVVPVPIGRAAPVTGALAIRGRATSRKTARLFGVEELG